MNDDELGRRASDSTWLDTSRILAILYTLGYFLIVLIMMLRGIPTENKDAINQLLGALTIIQTGIVTFYFRGSRESELMQQRLMSSKERADSAVQKIAEAAPAVAAAVVAAEKEKKPDGPISAEKIEVEGENVTVTRKPQA